MWDLLHEQLGCPLVMEPFYKGFTSLKVIPSSQTKSLFKLVSSVSLKGCVNNYSPALYGICVREESCQFLLNLPFS